MTGHRVCLAAPFCLFVALLLGACSEEPFAPLENQQEVTKPEINLARRVKTQDAPSSPTAPISALEDVAPHSVSLTTVSSGNVAVGGFDPQYCADPERCDGSGGGGWEPGEGYSLPGLTMDTCRYRTVTGQDVDGDGVDDECEWQLAYNFRPVLRFSRHDGDKSRETYWMAHHKRSCGAYYYNGVSGYCTAILDVVRIAYILGYHRDTGLFGHDGDSEIIILEVAYDSYDNRWKTSRAFLSAHYGVVNPPADKSRWWWYPEFAYPSPSHFKWYPRVWVADDKHANYGSKSACNSGAWLFADDCDDNTVNERVEVVRSRNIGERNHKLIDRTTSVQGFPGTEWFWTNNGDFRGWLGGTNEGSTAYYYFLSAFMSWPSTIDLNVF